MSLVRRSLLFTIITVVFTFSLFGICLTAYAQEPPTIGEQFEDIADQGIIFAGICEEGNDPCDCRDEGRCSLEDLLQVLVNISVFILGISGTVLLLVIFYGGFMWITAHGNSNMIESGKKAITAGIIGLIIIFGSYAAITLLISVVRTGDIPETGENLEDVIEEDDNIIETIP